MFFFPRSPRFRSRLDSLAFLLANVFVRYHQSTVGKKTADLYFTTIPKIYNSQNFFSSIKLVRKDSFKSVLAGLNRFTKVGKVKHNSPLVETFVTVTISANLKLPSVHHQLFRSRMSSRLTSRVAYTCTAAPACVFGLVFTRQGGENMLSI